MANRNFRHFFSDWNSIFGPGRSPFPMMIPIAFACVVQAQLTRFHADGETEWCIIIFIRVPHVEFMKEAIVGVIAVMIMALLAGIYYQNHRRFHKPLLTTQYQAVMLENGSMFYGRIDHLGTDHPVLRHALSVHRELDPQTNQPRYVLVKRKDELNGADHIIFPATAIVFIEPVQPNSVIGKLIEQSGVR